MKNIDSIFEGGISVRKLSIVLLASIIIVFFLAGCILQEKSDVTVSISVTLPESDTFTVKTGSTGVLPNAAFDVNITKVTVVVKTGTTQVFQQDFSSVSGISFKLEKAGTYTVELYAYGNINGQLVGIFYATKDVTLNYGTNYIELEGIFFKAFLEYSIKMDDVIARNWDITEAKLSLVKNTTNAQLDYDFTSEAQASPTNFTKTIEIDPGIWKITVSVKLKNKNDDTEFTYHNGNNAYRIFYPSITEKYEITATDIEGSLKVFLNGILIDKPYIPPVQSLRAWYDYKSNKMTISWLYPWLDSKTKFQIFQKLKTKKGIELIGETTSTTFETIIGENYDLIENLEYYAVNAIKEGKESGPVEVYPLAVKVAYPEDNQVVSRGITIRVVATQHPSISNVELKINGNYFGNDSWRPYEFWFDSTNYYDGTYSLSATLKSSSGILTEDINPKRLIIENWQKTYGTNSLYDVIESNDGNFIVIASTSSNMEILKIKRDGNVFWRKSFPDINFDGRYLVAKSEDGYLICGWKDVTDRSTDGVVFKINEDGEKVWEKTYGDTSEDRIYSIIQKKNGNYLLTGYKGSKGWLIEISKEGDIVSELTFDTVGQLKIVKEASDGSIILGGISEGAAWLGVVDSDKNLKWSWKSPNSTNYSEIYDVLDIGDGIIVKTRGFTHKVIKFNLTGNYMWEKNMGSSTSTVARTKDDCILTSNGKKIYKMYRRQNNDSNIISLWVVSLNVGSEVRKVIECSDGDLVGIGDNFVFRRKANGDLYY